MKNLVRGKKNPIVLQTCFFLLLFLIDPAYPLVFSADPFEAKDRNALLTRVSDKTIKHTLNAVNPSPKQLVFSNPKATDQIPLVSVGGTLIFGPITFLREKGVPKTEWVSFGVADAGGRFLLRLTNGTQEGAHRISGGTIKLNGERVFRPSELNQKVAELSRQVMLSPGGNNFLEVKLRGAPGSFVTLEVFLLNQGACQVLDIHTFERRKGKPFEETLEFELSSQFFGPFMLNLTNGTADGHHRVDSAIITLNGKAIFKPSDFNEKVGKISRVVSLQPTNKIRVELHGGPGDFLTLEIVGYDNTPPVVTLVNPSSGDTFDTSPITVSGIVDDPSSVVTINGIGVQVGSDGSFTAEGVILTEGENLIKVVATDSCGNQGEDQILVYLNPPSQGASLTLCAEPFREQRPSSPGENCSPQAFGRYYGLVTGVTDETATSITLNGILLPDGVLINEQGDIFEGMRKGTFFWAFVNIPQVDGVHPITAMATNSDGGHTEATVYFIRDTAPPGLMVATPTDGLITSNAEVTITGTVDDPEAVVRLGGYAPEIPVLEGGFAMTYTLPREGANYLTITAVDSAGNSAFVSRMVILDTQPPQIDVISPAEGQVVNTSTHHVTGNIIEENISGVTVSVNGGQPQPLVLTGTSFSGFASLAPGQNSLVFHAVDRAGNNASAVRSVLLDVEAPAVAIITPLPGVLVSGVLEITVEASDTASGIASVTLLVDGEATTTVNQAPFSYSVDTTGLAPGSHTLTAEATDGAGNHADATIVVTVMEPESMSVEITSPANGATINKSNAIVKGRINNEAGEVGVVVNGVIAEVQGSDFAVIVPLQPGENIITATATKPEGVQGQARITINTEAQEEFVRLTATPTSGILDRTGILSVTFEAAAYLVHPVSSYSWDFDGDGMPEATGREPSIPAQYQDPGIYYPRVVITDNQGNTYSETTLVHVLSREEMDRLLRAKWEGMKGALLNGDMETALQYFVGLNREKYEQIFVEIGSDRVNRIFSGISEFKLYTLCGQVAGCGAIRVETGGTYSYPVTFVRDENGIWRIKGF